MKGQEEVCDNRGNKGKDAFPQEEKKREKPYSAFCFLIFLPSLSPLSYPTFSSLCSYYSLFRQHFLQYSLNQPSFGCMLFPHYECSFIIPILKVETLNTIFFNLESEKIMYCILGGKF